MIESQLDLDALLHALPAVDLQRTVSAPGHALKRTDVRIGVAVAVFLGLAAVEHADRVGVEQVQVLGLAQAGEFGFVLLSFSLQNHVIPPELAKTLSLVVALSMLLTPLLFILYDKLLLNREGDTADQPADQIDEQGQVIIAGNGRFGQIVNRLLLACGVKTIVLDHEF